MSDSPIFEPIHGGAASRQARRLEPLTLRMLGQDVTLRRDQWQQLAAMLVPTNPHDARDAADLADRIAALVS